MKRTYKGWIPNVTGRISFSTIGHTAHPARCICANRSDTETRFLAAFQSRDILDLLLPFKKILAPMVGLEGHMFFAILAKTAPHNGRSLEKFEGKIYIYHNKEMWKDGPRDDLKVFNDSLKNISKFRGRSLTSIIGESYESLKTGLQTKASFVVDFILLRSGEVTITHDEDLVISPSAPKIPAFNPDDFLQLIASQAFFFLKDASHTHQHHDPKTDTVVDLYRVEGTDDVCWREQTLYALYRKIIQYKKNKTEEAAVNSLGMLAYALAFKKISESALGDESTKLPK